MNKQVSFAAVISILSLLVILAAAPIEAYVADVGHVVNTKSGKVSGTTVEDGGEKVHIFKGIPYAAPPVGEWRWKAPQPGKPWSDVRDATNWCNQCAQRAGSRMGVSGQINEDCLYLHVVTAARTTSEKRPVMVFLHGAGLTSATGNSLTYNNTALPRKGVVVVTVNSRLGPLGYMAHPALSAESGRGASGNYGTLDLIASLRWVKENIEAFGGNPDNVLIFGESGGGTKTLSLLTSPLAKGLFHKAIVESGSALITPERATALERAEGAGKRIAAKLGMDNAEIQLAALRAAKWEDIVAAAGDKVNEFWRRTSGDSMPYPSTVSDPAFDPFPCLSLHF